MLKTWIKPMLWVVWISCGSTLWAAPHPAAPSNLGRAETGHASYYADAFEGKRAANGQRFANDQMIAAHRRLPLGSRIKVINLRNQRSVVVKVVDRGPFVEGRVVDLSQSAFAQIADLEDGVIPVRLELIKPKRRARGVARDAAS